MNISNTKENQARFLDEMAMRAAIDAAVRETKVYSENTSPRDKELARKKWQAYIREIAKGYKVLRNKDYFISDVRRLQNMINSDQEINHLFCKLNEAGDIIADEYGIRIAQCQKSLSLYLKYLWCYGLIETPPVCPIDRVILNICKKYYQQNRNVADRQEKIELCSLKWTRIDDINKYTRLVEITEEVAGSQICTAEWELVKWMESIISQTTNQQRSSLKMVENKKERKVHSIESTSMDITDEFINEIKTQFPSINISRNKSISHGPKSELIADLSDGWRLAVGRKKTYYFCGMYSKEQRENKYPGIFGNPVGGGYGYFSKFQTAEEALRQFDNILQTENSIDD